MKLRIRPAFFLYVFGIWLIDGFFASVSLLSALLIHEGAHLVVGLCCHESYEQLELTPLGGILTYKAGRASCKGIRGMMIAAAGPAGNYAAILFLSTGRLFANSPRALLEPFIMANLAMLLINLLPVFPLDGGRILFSIGYYLFPLSGLIRLLTAMGFIMGAMLMAVAVYGAIAWGKLNISLLAGGTYIMMCAGNHGEILFSSNLYTTIEERLNDSKALPDVHMIQISADTRLFDILSKLYRYQKCVFLLQNGDQLQLLSEEELLKIILLHPNKTVNEAIDS